MLSAHVKTPLVDVVVSRIGGIAKPTGRNTATPGSVNMFPEIHPAGYFSENSIPAKPKLNSLRSFVVWCIS
jgi:hypothetical protein